MRKLIGFGGAGILGLVVLARPAAPSALFSSNYLPHRYCYLAQPGLVWTNAVADGLIAVSYTLIFACLFWVFRKLRNLGVLQQYHWIFVGFGLFILACGLTHGMEIVTIWWPLYPLSAAFKVICAAVSIPTAILFAKATPKFAGNIRQLLDSLAKAKRETEDDAANYRGQIEAINQSQMMIEFRMDGTIIKANANYLRAFGYQDLELAGKHHSIFITPEYRQGAEYNKFWEQLRAGRYQAGQFSRIDKHGNDVWIEASYNPIFGSDGLPVRIVKFASNVTDRVRIQNDLKDAEARLQAIVDNVLDGIITVDHTGTIASVNLAAISIFGYEPGDLVGQNIKMLMPEPDRSGHDGQLAWYRPGAPAGAVGIGRELEGLTRRGRVFPMELTVTDFAHSGERMFVGLVRDITERKDHERALRRTKDELDRTGRIACVGGWELDLVTNEVLWSTEVRRLIGVASEYQPTLEEGIQFYHPDARPIISAAIEKAIADHGAFALDLPLTRADGRSIWARVTASVECVHGKPLRLVGAFQDVTDRVGEQAALVQANTRIKLATESGGIGIWDWDIANDSVICDPMMYRLYGLTTREAEDTSKNFGFWASLIHPEDREAAQLALRDSLEGIKPYDTLFRVVWEDKSVHHIRASGNLTRNDNGQAVRMMCINWDVTDLIRANEASQQAMEIAEDSNRAKLDFLANMSHEIRTPMNAILGLTYLARRSNSSAKQLDYLTKIGSAADSLLGIINDILDFSKIEAGKLELEVISFSLKDVLRNLLDVVGQQAQQKGLTLVSSVASNVPSFLVGDPLRLGQILINLVNNAVKFTDFGEVTIAVEAQELTLNDLRLNVSVSDTGIGMNPKQVAKLFQSFHQGDSSFTRKFRGTGLGLAISKQLCELMHGEITVKSELGKGSTFWFTARFGIGRDDMGFSSAARRDALAKKSVLIVDDSESMRDLLSAMLDANGFKTKAVSSGEEALSALAHASQSGEPMALVLMDLRLPGIDGIEASRRIKANPNYSLIPEILMVSVFEREEVLAADGVVDGFLTKPISEEQLMDAVTTTLGASPVPARPVPAIEARKVLTSELAGRRVLLVEDNEVNRFLATELLADLGIHVSIALNGREGVDRVNSEPFDLVLMDIQMPVMDGLAATQLIRTDSRFQSLPIVAMTAHAMSGDREQSLSAGMNDHLTKPINPEALTEMLLQWMPTRPISQPTLETLSTSAVSSTGELPAQLPPFDIPAALARANGKHTLLRKMLLSFRDQYRDGASELRQWIAQGKTEEANQFAHSLKGVAATLEATDLANIAAAIENAIRRGVMQGIESLVDTLEPALDSAIAAANSLDRRAVPPTEFEAPAGKGEMCILLVDDQFAYLDLLKDVFADHGEILYAGDGLTALQIAADRVPDLILLDVVMAGIDGYEVFSRLKAEDRTRDIPIIFLTSLGSVGEESKGLAMGACDYVTKPINPVAVLTRVNHQVGFRRAHQELTRLTAEVHAAQLVKEEERAAAVVRTSQQALQLRDDFLSHVSHELRAPLTSIYFCSENMADGLAGTTTPEQDDYLKIIKKNVRQIQSMIEDLLAVTAAKNGKLRVDLQEASLSEAIMDAVNTTEANASEKGVNLSCIIPPGLPSAYADPVRLLQVLIVLCDNAIKFTPAGGSVKVHARAFDKVPGYLLVEVSDTGCGIKPELLERIFEQLYQVNDSNSSGSKGLGLGLHIAKELMARQGGTLWATSTPGSGSVFSFTLPAFVRQLSKEPLPSN